MNIRRASLTDLKRIQEMNHELFLHDLAFDTLLTPDWPLSPVGKTYFEDKILKHDQVCLVALDEEVTVGYLAGSLGKKDQTRSNIMIANLDNMFVYPEHRGKGIGRELYEHFIAWAREHTSRIEVNAYLANADALKFYEHVGFRLLAVNLEQEI